MGPRTSAPQRQSAWPPHIEKNEPKPAPKAAANSNVLGVWENGIFRFNSPEAKETWDRESYEQGVNTDTWSLGKEIDAQSASLAQAGLAGAAMPGLYRGPDGKYRLMNLKTIESQAARDHRNRSLKGMKIEQLEAATTMPGVDEWVAQWKSAQAPANDNASTISSTGQRMPAIEAAVGNSQAAEQTGKVIKVKAGGRGPMPGAFNAADVQNVRDLERIGVNSVLGDYGDEARAGLSAVGAWWEGGSFGEAYDSKLEKEKAETAAAQERQESKGTTVELVTGLIPFVGDASGAVADFKDWKEHGADWGWSDYGLVALGLAPGMPNRKTLKKGKKLAGELVDKAKSSTKGEGEELLGAADNARKSDVDEVRPDAAIKNPEQTFDPKSFFPKDENDILTKKQALDLPGEKVGLYWVVEPETHIPHAAAYEREGNGYVWSEKHDMPAKPSLRWDNPDGDDLVKFDHIDPTPQATYLIILVDSKADVPPAFRGAEVTAAADIRRQVNAVRQNNKVIDGPKLKIRHELPDESRAQAMIALIKRLGYEDEIVVQVREASQQAQEMFKKLRKKE